MSPRSSSDIGRSSKMNLRVSCSAVFTMPLRFASSLLACAGSLSNNFSQISAVSITLASDCVGPSCKRVASRRRTLSCASITRATVIASDCNPAMTPSPAGNAGMGTGASCQSCWASVGATSGLALSQPGEAPAGQPPCWLDPSACVAASAGSVSSARLRNCA